jgi:hypothetical protein
MNIEECITHPILKGPIALTLFSSLFSELASAYTTRFVRRRDSDRKSLFVGGRWEAGRSGESA